MQFAPVLLAMIEFLIVVPVEATLMPVLFVAMVTCASVTVAPFGMSIPPPVPVAVLPLIVLFVTCSVAPKGMAMPPPLLFGALLPPAEVVPPMMLFVIVALAPL